MTTKTFSPDLLELNEACRTVLHKAQQQGHNVYLLVDNSALDGQWWLARPDGAMNAYGPWVQQLNLHGFSWRTLLGDHEQPRHVAAVPLLVSWDFANPLTEVYARAVFRQAALSHALQWVVSPQPAAVVAARLAARLSVNMAGSAYVLRYFDNRVMAEWLPCLNAAQRQAFLSVAVSWHMVDRDGVWQTLETCFSEEDTPSPFAWALEEAQEKALLDIGTVDRVMSYVEETLGETWMPGQAPSARYATLAAVLKQARERGIQDVPSFAQLAVQTMRSHLQTL